MLKRRKRGDKKAGALHSTMVDRRLENAIWSQPKQPFMSFIVTVYLKCQMTNKSCYNFPMIEMALTTVMFNLLLPQNV